MQCNDKKLNEAIENMAQAIKKIIKPNKCTIYIYGSICLNDFNLGWSDIDILCLTESPIDNKTQNKLVTLRQELLSKDINNPYYRSFEGAIVYADEFENNLSCNAVYWGTRGEKINNNYILDSFSRKEIIENGILICGVDNRHKMINPTFDDLKKDIIHHYNTIREHAKVVSRNIKSYGWILDIARCIYTLQTEKIIAKTKAGIWALENNLCPNQEALKKALQARQNPQIQKFNEELLDYTEFLGQDIQQFADILENELNSAL